MKNQDKSAAFFRPAAGPLSNRALHGPVTFVASLLLANSLWMQCAAADSASTQPAPQAVPSHCRMRMPPQEGTETGTNGGGSRGCDSLQAPQLFAPATATGRTVNSQPTLYFYLPAGTPKKGVLTIVEVETPRKEVLLEMPLDNLSRAGVHAIDTAPANHPLKPGVLYQWSVNIGPDANGENYDAYAGAFIVYDDKDSKALADRVKGLSADEQAAIYGDAGEWHDAVAALELATAAGSDSAAADLRSMLKQFSIEPDIDHLNLVPVK